MMIRSDCTASHTTSSQSLPNHTPASSSPSSSSHHHLCPGRATKWMPIYANNVSGDYWFSVNHFSWPWEALCEWHCRYSRFFNLSWNPGSCGHVNHSFLVWVFLEKKKRSFINMGLAWLNKDWMKYRLNQIKRIRRILCSFLLRPLSRPFVFIAESLN